MRDKLFREAVEAHIQGDLDRALTLYQHVLKLRPEDWAALHNTAVILLSRNEDQNAIRILQKVLRLNPNYPDGLNTFATALKRTGKSEVAIRSLEKALSLSPDFVEARFNLGNLYTETGCYEKALEAFEQVLALNPNDHDAMNSIGSVLLSLGRHAEARSACLKSIQMNPRQASAYYNLGRIHMKEGREEEAAESFRLALQIDPGFSDAHLNLGILKSMAGKMAHAVECFKKAVYAKPDSADAYYNLGLAFERQGDLDGEISTAEKALIHCPDAAQTWIGAARVFSKIADWGRVDAFMERIVQRRFSENEVSLLSSALFMLHSYPMPDRRVFEKHVEWGDHLRRITGRLFGNSSFDFSTHDLETSRLRIGYVSPDFCRHSVGWFFREIALHHDQDRFEINCYSTDKRDDDITEEIKASVSSFSTVHAWDTLRLAQQIYRDGIHILVDLAGHTLGNRLDVFALRPAPVQVTMIGYPNGTGLKSMDYRITDQHAETRSSASRCVERHVYIPSGFLPFYPVDHDIGSLKKQDLGLPKDNPVLISLNRTGKLRPEVLRVWDSILTHCPEPVLALGCGHVDRNDLKGNILSHFTPQNRDRVFFLPRARTEELHRARYSLATLALDCFPYAGTTTSYEAIAMGVPVMTFVGERHVQRTTFSLLNRLEISETVAGSEKEYVEKASFLIEHPEMLERIRAKLKKGFVERAHSHAGEYVRDLERAFLIMWERRRRGEPLHEIVL